MKNELITANYNSFVQEIKQRIRAVQYEALRAVNNVLFHLVKIAPDTCSLGKAAVQRRINGKTHVLQGGGHVVGVVHRIPQRTD